MTAAKTTKWEKKVKKTPTPIRADQAEAAVEQPETPVTESKPPEPEDYMALNPDGTAKDDGCKRVVLMVAADGKTLLPVAWWGMSVLEVLVTLTEAAKIMAVEVAMKVIEREETVAKDQDAAIAAVLRKLGVFDVESDEAATAESEGE